MLCFIKALQLESLPLEVLMEGLHRSVERTERKRPEACLGDLTNTGLFIIKYRIQRMGLVWKGIMDWCEGVTREKGHRLPDSYGAFQRSP